MMTEGPSSQLSAAKNRYTPQRPNKSLYSQRQTNPMYVLNGGGSAETASLNAAPTEPSRGHAKRYGATNSSMTGIVLDPSVMLKQGGNLHFQEHMLVMSQQF